MLEKFTKFDPTTLFDSCEYFFRRLFTGVLGISLFIIVQLCHYDLVRVRADQFRYSLSYWSIYRIYSWIHSEILLEDRFVLKSFFFRSLMERNRV